MDLFGGACTFPLLVVPLVLLLRDYRRIILVNDVVWGDRLIVMQFFNLVEGGMLNPWTGRAMDIPTGINASRINLSTWMVPLCLALRAILDVGRGLARFLILEDTNWTLD